MIKLRRKNIDGTEGYSDLFVVASEIKAVFMGSDSKTALLVGNQLFAFTGIKETPCRVDVLIAEQESK